jgi:hypothetical protein
VTDFGTIFSTAPDHREEKHMNPAHGHYSTGQSHSSPHAPEEDRTGHFSEGQERAHEEVASDHGHFSRGQDKTPEHDHTKERVGSFGDAQYS